ncbi:endoglucanase 25 [Physcomitrium patens]|uniref:Endoglucanase n=1 Tax=Physcomitrium patens TaxID=3218 RepID=A9T2X6_PHYPA|nr:endoglucanase 25-like [Physcomitrium patens]XP_024371992.1 endoglucanase 25-like [Physcomitrium patens]XP_024371993.1 endoglucanase 25-like [Physcomitrium patens]XP_024371994.1 endoglucanase 25-like [Physcomitrium patens]XP_024371995.1 endoglucanase 25-like [Physcomitrium patens]PNR58072.1 hypothetical protein PHYPA_005067 [Physcomitrium patens]|eukprot:XP_024371991.1 endoglucanase 25-like [Physcomitrella patens]
MYNTWGGPMEMATDSGAEDDTRSRNLDVDRASVKSLEETQQSWLLEPKTKKKKKEIDLGCMVCSRKLFLIIFGTIFAASAIVGLSILIWKVAPRKHHRPPPLDNYTVALKLALKFFDAQKSGRLPKTNNISWRGTSALRDGRDAVGGNPTNLSGGFYDAGDNIKFGFPGAFAMTLLSWSVIEYKAKFQAAGELNHVKEIIKWGTDYMLRTFNYTSPNVDYVFAQVGDANTSDPNDHTCWEKPEDMDYPRPAYAVNSGPDLAGEMAAALAAASIVFKDSPQYSRKLRTGAINIWTFARDKGKRQRFVANIPEGEVGFYNSTSFWDEYIWGGAWMYYATGNNSYLQLITNPSLAKHANANGGGPFYGTFNWDNKLAGAQVLLSRLLIMKSPGYPYEQLLREYHNQTETIMCNYLPQYKKFNVTKGGLTMFLYGKGQQLQYTVANSMIASLYAEFMKAAAIPGWKCKGVFYPAETLNNWARSQINYVLGHNPMNMSYVVGYGKKYPKQVHHRGASIPKSAGRVGCTQGHKYRDANSPNPHILEGAMVGGPDKFDKYKDRRTNYEQTEPTLVANAALVGALASLSTATKTGVDANTIFNALPPLFRAPPPAPEP